ncbi:MAG: hypothetical protein IJ422_05225 [Oscillospiraceae bacterium]|nr:hypothetical protein [Oscillospiraceae bacterium]
MKKILIFILAAVMLLTLCACGDDVTETTAPETTAPAGTDAPETTGAPEGTDAPETTAPAGEMTDLEKALSCVDKSVDELYALIGEPMSADYAASCLGPGEDGNLYYDGFVVYTYRENGEETVIFAE